MGERQCEIASNDAADDRPTASGLPGSLTAAAKPRSLLGTGMRWMLLVAVAFAFNGMLATPAAAQVAGIEPSQGKTGTPVTVRGNLIGCYTSGPGPESSTWGLPEKVTIYFDPEVGNVTPGDVKKMQSVGSHAFGDAGWSVQFSVPGNAKPGPHQVVAAFEPQCNFKGLDKAGKEVVITRDPQYQSMGFCVLESASTPCQTSLGSGGRIKNTTPGIDNTPTGNQELGIAVVSGGIIWILVGATVVAWYTGGTVLGVIGGALGIGKSAKDAKQLVDAGRTVKQLTENAERMNKAYRAVQAARAAQLAAQIATLEEGSAAYQAAMASLAETGFSLEEATALIGRALPP